MKTDANTKEAINIKTIIEDQNGMKYNLILTESQVKFAKWLTINNVLYNIEVIEEMKWEKIG